MGITRQLGRFAKLFGGGKAIVANSITGLVLFSLSDALAQEFENQYESQKPNEVSQKREVEQSPRSLLDNFDRTRFVTAAGMGVLLTGFVYPLAYSKLDKIIVGTHWKAVLKKSVLEIFTVGIVVNSLSMFGRGYFTGRHTAVECVSHVREELPTVTVNDAKIWIPYNFIAFGYIPLSVRPATTSFMEALWQTYISLRSNNYQPEVPKPTIRPRASLHTEIA